jgi:hypothetical protein
LLTQQRDFFRFVFSALSSFLGMMMILITDGDIRPLITHRGGNGHSMDPATSTGLSDRS